MLYCIASSVFYEKNLPLSPRAPRRAYFGKIGTSTAFSLKGTEAVVSTYDINPAKDILAQVLGFFPRPLKALLEQSQIVVGCTGQTSVRLVDMPHIRDGALLVSASSKQVGFAVADFAEHCEVSKRSELVTKYVQKENGKTFYILNEGKPVNFRDHSIIGTILDLIYSELFLCMRKIATGRVTPGLSHSPGAIHNEVSSVCFITIRTSFPSMSTTKYGAFLTA